MCRSMGTFWFCCLVSLAFRSPNNLIQQYFSFVYNQNNLIFFCVIVDMGCWTYWIRTTVYASCCLHSLYLGSHYRNDRKFSDRHAWANGADPGQTRSSLIGDCTVCNSLCICIFWTHYSSLKPFRMITANFSVVRIFRSITVFPPYSLLAHQ